MPTKPLTLYAVQYRGQTIGDVYAKDEMSAMRQVKKMFSEPALGWGAITLVS